MAHLHDVLDNDKHFKIDAETRAIVYAGENLPTLIQNDHNSERFTFEIPKSIDGHDTELCNKIRVHYINVSAENSFETNPGVYEVDDIKVSQDDPTKMIFSWLLDRDATTYVGTLTFLIECMCVSDGDVVDYSWHTGIYTGVVISEGMDNSDIVVGKYYDVIDKWVAQIEAEGNRVVADALARIDTAAKEAENSSVSGINAHAETVKKDLTIHGLTIDDTLVQETGSSEHKVMSQKATTEMGDALSQDNYEKYTELTGRLNAAEETIDNILINNTHRAYVPLKPEDGGSLTAVSIEVGKTYYIMNPYDYCIYTDVFAYTEDPEDTSEIGSIFSLSELMQGFVLSKDWCAFRIANVFIDTCADTEQKTTYIEVGFGYDDDLSDAQYVCLYDANAEMLDNQSTWNIGEYYMHVSPIAYPGTAPTIYEAVDINPFDLNAFRIEANGIRDISKTNTESVNGVNVHTYTILLDDGTAKTFQVGDGVGISDFAVIDYGDYEDTYRIEFTNGTSHTFKVPNNNSVGIRTFDSGPIIHATDLTHLEHTVKAKVWSKNLIPYPYPYSYGTVNGVEFTPNADGSITAVGTVTDGTFANVMVCKTFKPEVGKTYYIGNSPNLLLAYKDTAGTTRYLKNQTFTWQEGYEFIQIYVQYSPGVTVDETTYPMLCESDVAVDFTPYVDPSSVTLRRCGKNLITYPYAYGSGTIADVIYTDNGDGTVTANGTATDNSIQYLILSESLDKRLHLAPGTYTLSGCPSGGSQSTYRLCIKTDDATPVYYYDIGDGITFTLTEDKLVQIYIYVGNGVSVDNLIFKPQLEVGDTATEFEKYVGAEYGIASDGVPVSRVTSLNPTMNLIVNKKGTIIDATYNVDQTAAYNKINALLETLLNGGA